MINTPRVALPIAATVITIIVMLVVYLTFFAAQGGRFTSDDGKRLEKCSIERDILLGKRIDGLESHVDDISATLERQITILENRVEELGSFHPDNH